MGDSLTLFIDKTIDSEGVETILETPKAIGYATSHNFSIKSGAEEVTHKGTGGWTIFEYGKKSWELSTEAFEVDSSAYYNGIDVIDMIIEGSKVRVLIGEHDEDYVMKTATTTFYEGLALIDTVEKNASAGERVKYSITFAPASKLEKKSSWVKEA